MLALQRCVEIPHPLGRTLLQTDFLSETADHRLIAIAYATPIEVIERLIDDVEQAGQCVSVFSDSPRG